MQNPYQNTASPTGFRSDLDSTSKPQVCVWYSVYCTCFLLLYLLVGIAGVMLFLFANEIAASSHQAEKDVDRVSNILMGVMLTLVSFLLCIVFAIGLSVPRKKWGWIYGFFPIAIGLTSPCCMPASVPLLLFWLKPNTRRWFNVD